MIRPPQLIRIRSLTLGLALCLLSSLTAAAEKEALPLWEAGAGFGIANSPHYPGADERQTLATPFPLFIYRGKTIKSDDSGIRGRLLNSERVALDLGFAFSLPTDSDDSDAREGMDDLDLGIEAGPNLNIKLREWGRNELKLQFPARALIVTDFSSASHEGWVFEPRLQLRLHQGPWAFDISASTLIASRKYHEYYYGVDQRFATADRPAYEAHGGYSRSGLRLGVLRSHGKWRFGAAVSHYTLANSQIDDSPLVKQNSSTYVGAVVLWKFAESKQRAATEEAGLLDELTKP